MKKLFMILAASAALFSSCTTDKDNGGDTNGSVDNIVETVLVDATSKTTWHYYNFKQKKFVGTGETSADATWAARTDWDVAICRYKVRTNSGTSGVGKGGLYTCYIGGDKTQSFKFDELTSVPAGATFTKDIEYSEEQMDESMLTESRSIAVVAVMEGMPPIWKKAPLYIMPNAEGTGFYKVDFLSYKNASGESGHVSFKFVAIAK